jgi:hypothetical protein
MGFPAILRQVLRELGRAVNTTSPGKWRKVESD